MSGGITMYDDTPITRRSALVLGGLGLGGTALRTGAMAKSQDEGNRDDENGEGNGDGMRQYRVTVANNTPGQPLTMPAVAAYRSSVEVSRSATRPTSRPDRSPRTGTSGRWRG